MTKLVQDKAYFCPECGSPSLDISVLAGGKSTCKSCEWVGTNEDLAALPIQHDFDSKDDITMSLVNDLRKIYAGDYCIPIGRFLMKWGFLSSPIDTKLFAKYLTAVAQGTFRAIVETRERIERETHD
jgi:hypothetical protein